MRKRDGGVTASGFTIIEVMLTLAISGMVLVGALIGVSGSISRQRYRDTVEDIASILRKQYDLVNRVQIERRSGTKDACNSITGTVTGSEDRGRSGCSIYGVAVTFGLPDKDGKEGKRLQTTNLIGKDLATYRQELTASGKNADEEIQKIDDLTLLKNLGVTDLYKDINTNKCRVTNLLTDETFKWGASLETTTSNQNAKILLLIVRSPRDGAIHTYVWNYSTQTNPSMNYAGDLTNACSGTQDGKSKPTVKKGLSGGNFKKNQTVQLCIKSDDMLATFGRRRMIEIASDGHNSSAVSLIDMDGEANKCR